MPRSALHLLVSRNRTGPPNTTQSRPVAAAATARLQDAHEDTERLAGEKAALADSVKHLAEKVRKLEGFKQLLVSNLAEEHGGALPQGFNTEPLPDNDTLISDILTNATPEPMPARPSLARVESRARQAACQPAVRFFVPC